jgi:TonB-linked SusC/RagA family outer membrane protein
MTWALSARALRLPGLVALAALLAVPPAVAQTGRIEGTVRDATTSSVIAGARVFIVGTTQIVSTGSDGTFTIENVPAGAVVVRVQVVGYQPTSASVAVVAGAVATANFSMHQAIVNLSEIVVTGVVGETERAKLPIDVAHIDAAQLPVPALDPLTLVQGKVAGAVVSSGSGRPGEAPSILLRGPTSIDASGRSQEPLYVVDGVILGSSVADLDGLDIQSVEIVKGAAASSLYGSRAENGVISITTKRGANAPEEVHFTVRSEGGFNRLPSQFDLTTHHAFLMNAAGTKFLDSNGNECDYLECPNVVPAGQKAGANPVSGWNTFQDLAWPGQTYDQVGRFFTGGTFTQQYVSAEGRSGGTNFHTSYTNAREEGIMVGQQGLWRNTLRMNLDQWVGSRFKVSASTYYSKSKEDNRDGPLFDLTRMPAGVDLLALNHCPATGVCKPWQQPALLPNGQQAPHDYYLEPDPFNSESANPLYSSFNGSDFVYRGRFLGSVDGRWQPSTWFALDGNVSYDRLDYKREVYTFKGYKTINPSPNTNLGNLSRNYSLTENFNASMDATITRAFGDLATRTQFRYLTEIDNYDYTNTTGRQFAVGGVPTIDNTDPSLTTGGSGLTKVRADGYYGIANLVYRDRYILDVMGRNDGSSLFGPDARRHWYYRVAGAWRVTQDVNLAHLDELKLRAAYGTAGGRPRFEAQYETYSVSNGQVTPVTLGNKNLKPENSGELDLGTDILALGGRVGLTFDYARTVTKDQILQVPLPAFAGFQSQWRNAGTLASHTLEASLDLQLMRSRSVNWSARVLFDATRQQITELNVPQFAYGAFGGNNTQVFFARKGEQIGTYYGTRLARSCADLLGALPCDQFAVNSDGLLVWVGPGGSLSNPQWGTQGPSFGFHGANQTLMWGSPIVGWGVDPITGDTTNFLKVGKTNPDFHMGFSTTFSWHNFTLYGLLEWVQGISVYNVPQQWAVFRQTAAIEDQTGVPDALQKPTQYYLSLYNASTLTPDNFFVQDGSFAKLREVSLQFRLGRDQLARLGVLRSFDGIAFSVIGRNLLTFSKYNGYDPEAGSTGGDTGSAAIARVDGYQYPNFRNFTFSISVTY